MELVVYMTRLHMTMRSNMLQHGVILPAQAVTLQAYCIVQAASV